MNGCIHIYWHIDVHSCFAVDNWTENLKEEAYKFCFMSNKNKIFFNTFTCS